jgi:hypothetical protein
MGLIRVNPVTAGFKARKTHYDNVFDNTIAIVEARHVHPLGGHFETQIIDTAFRVIPGPIFVEIDGTNVGNFISEVHVMCTVVTGTGTFQLYNKTTPGAIASSITTFTNTSPALVKSPAIALASGVNVYELQVKGSTANDRPAIWGAKLVLR